MKHVVVAEHGRILRADLSNRLLVRLQRFDSSHARKTGDSVFDWNHISHIKAKNYVGVVQVPGLTVEVLPKIDDAENDCVDQQQADAKTAQANLLFMLSFIRRIPIRDRDIAFLRKQQMPLNEALIAVFTRRLLDELRNGVVRNYVRREENLRVVKGKILVGPHARINAAHKERVFVGYDDFIADTWLNRILKAGCRLLLRLSNLNRTQQQLRIALVHLAEVSDCEVQTHDFDRVHISRNNQRMAVLFEFCRMLFAATTPSPSSGQSPTFSLLFPMETLFEEFIARFIKRYAGELGLTRSKIHAQAHSRRLWLLRAGSEGKFRLIPDLVVDETAKTPRLLLDTKWKRLKTDAEDSRNGVSQADLYQMYAYATRYRCPDNVLLYPRVPGVSANTYGLDGTESDQRIRVEFVDVSIDMSRNRQELINDLWRVIHGEGSR